jgi:hypothetical protein
MILGIQSCCERQLSDIGLFTFRPVLSHALFCRLCGDSSHNVLSCMVFVFGILSSLNQNGLVFIFFSSL